MAGESMAMANKHGPTRVDVYSDSAPDSVPTRTSRQVVVTRNLFVFRAHSANKN